MPTPLMRRRLYAPPQYPLLARFGADKSAPLGSPLAVDAGSLTINDTTNKLSQSGGKLVASGINAGGDPRAVSVASFARLAGRAFLFDIQWTTARSGAGWTISATPTTVPGPGVSDASGSLTAYGSANNIVEALFATGTTYQIAAILRAAGGFLLAKGGAYSQWTLLRVDNSVTTTPMWPTPLLARAVDCSLSVDNPRVLDLPAPWNSDYGIATSRIVTTSANDTLVSMSDAVIEHTITAATGVTQELRVRRTDASNYWIVRMSQAGSTIKLIEFNAGVETERSSVAQTWTNATQYRVVATCDGATIKTYVADVAANSYASATFNQTATGVQVDTAGSNLACYPRYLSLPQGA